MEILKTHTHKFGESPRRFTLDVEGNVTSLFRKRFGNPVSEM